MIGQQLPQTNKKCYSVSQCLMWPFLPLFYGSKHSPGEFEAAWKELICEFDLHNDPTMESLYQQWRSFIPAYFKKDYCRRMASTQRSESTNFILKKGFVNKGTALHRLAKKVMNFMHSRLMKEAEETYLSTVKYTLKFCCVWHNSCQISLTV